MDQQISWQPIGLISSLLHEFCQKSTDQYSYLDVVVRKIDHQRPVRQASSELRSDDDNAELVMMVSDRRNSPQHSLRRPVNEFAETRLFDRGPRPPLSTAPHPSDLSLA
jgi:hypothetical protein